VEATAAVVLAQLAVHTRPAAPRPL